MSKSLEDHFHVDDKSPNWVRVTTYAYAIEKLRDLGETVASIRLGQYLTDTSPDKYQACWPIRQEYVISLVKNNQKNEAIELYKQWLKQFPDDAFAWHLYGQFVSDCDINESIRAYTEAIRIEPDQSSWYQNLGVELDELGKVEEAIEVWENGLDVDPEDIGILYNLELAYKEVGNTPKVEEMNYRMGEYYRSHPDADRLD